MYSSSSDDDARRVLLNAFNFDKYSWYSLLLFSTFVFSSICLSISIYSLFFSYSSLVAFFSKDFISSMRLFTSLFSFNIFTIFIVYRFF